MKVTCVCPTRNRREWLPKAIQCFLRQTYENRELLILADGEDVADLVPNDSRIIVVPVEGRPVVGTKRNIGCQLASGDLIAHWDDDDYSAPGRLAEQVWRLRLIGKAVTGYHSMKFTDGSRWWQYSGSGKFVLGTSLCYRREWWEKDNFQQVQIGQDEQFSMRAYAKGQLDAQGDMDLMYATVHPENSSPRKISAPSAYAPIPSDAAERAFGLVVA